MRGATWKRIGGVLRHPRPRIERDPSTRFVAAGLWGSDYPHYEGTFPYTREALRLTFADFDPEETRMMLGENAAALYGFDLAALEPVAQRVAVTPELVATPLDEIPPEATSPMLWRMRFERRGAAS